MAQRRRQRVVFTPAIVGSVLLLAGCGAASTISESPTTPSPSIQPNACNLLSDADIAAATSVPSAQGSSSSTSSAPTVSHVYSVEAVNVAGTKTVGQCVWQSDGGGQVIALVIPNTQIAKLTAYTSGATQVGPAYVQEGNGRGFVSIQDGSAVIAITLVLDADAGVRTAHLADLARTASGAPVPVVTPGAEASASSSSSSASSAGGPGQVVQGQTAAATDKQTDDLAFSPTSVTIKAGQVLEWTNSGTVAHNVTFDAYPDISSDTMNGGDKFEVKFTQPGTYQFHCTFHPGMQGTVTVT